MQLKLLTCRKELARSREFRVFDSHFRNQSRVTIEATKIEKVHVAVPIDLHRLLMKGDEDSIDETNKTQWVAELSKKSGASYVY